MDALNASRLLSPLHAEALELAAQGFESGEIGRLLDLDPRAVEPVLRIARAKLAALERLEGLGRDQGEHLRRLEPPTDEEEPM
jgi:DNA-directed RNA polymerase specialized sigma24 family protein